MKRDNEKKRHHYVPVTYLRHFADSTGRIFAYRKDSPQTPLHVRPSEIAFERYYYSQPIPGGGQDNNRIKNLFSEVEMKWPHIVHNLSKRLIIDNQLEALFNFISLLRVRGPAARDPVEFLIAHMAHRQMLRLAASGKIPHLPANLSCDDIDISVDPHRSLHAMVQMLNGLAELWNYVGLEVVHNTTTEPFATSDNPFIYFNPDIPEDKILPYKIRPKEESVELLLPISPRLMLRGHTDFPVIRTGSQLRHVEMTSTTEVDRVNRFVARFGYRFVFANHNALEALVSEHAALSPTIRFDVIPSGTNSEYNIAQFVFGPRPRKPKYKI